VKLASIVREARRLTASLIASTSSRSIWLAFEAGADAGMVNEKMHQQEVTRAMFPATALSRSLAGSAHRAMGGLVGFALV
jgi:hypothetical protein